MSTITETELPTLAIDTPEFAADPNPGFEVARRQHPWLGRFSQGYVVYGFEACCDLYADADNLIAGYGAVADYYGVRDTLWGRFMQNTLSATVGERHDRLRGCVNHAFTPRRANNARPLMREVIGELLDEFVPRGSFDFVLFASYFPVSVMCGLLGIPAKRVTAMRDALENQLLALTLDHATKPLWLGGFELMWTFANEVIEEHEAKGELNPEEGLLDAMIAAKNSGQMDDEELRYMLLTTIFGGFDTSKNQLAMTMHLLLDRPEMYQRCAEDLDFCKKVTEESFRHSAIASKFRQACNDFTYGGHQFRKGDTILLASALANRDDAMFADPYTFDPDRPNAGRHIAMGRGPHICIGQFIARAQIQEGLHLIAQRMRNPRRTGAMEWRSMLGAWGPKSLPIAFDPAPAAQIAVAAE